MHTLMRALALVAGLITTLPLLSISAAAQAPTWPQRPVKFILPFGPGAGADIGARLLADRLTGHWGKGVIIENRPGADGLVAIQAFLSANDDHTLLYGASGSFTVHPHQYQKLPYAPGDLLPIARVSNTILAVGVPASINVASMKDFVERAKAQPGKMNAGVVPGITEFVFDYFVKTAGLNITKVPYRDIVQGATDLGEGRLQIYMSAYAILQPHVEGGRIKVLIVNGRERVPFLPDIPTAREAGFPSLELEGLVGLFGSKRMSDELREKIAADVIGFVKDPAVSARLAATAQAVNPGGPAEFTAAIEAQRAQIAAIAKELDVKPTR